MGYALVRIVESDGNAIFSFRRRHSVHMLLHSHKQCRNSLLHSCLGFATLCLVDNSHSDVERRWAVMVWLHSSIIRDREHFGTYLLIISSFKCFLYDFPFLFNWKFIRYILPHFSLSHLLTFPLYCPIHSTLCLLSLSLGNKWGGNQVYQNLKKKQKTQEIIGFLHYY